MTYAEMTSMLENVVRDDEEDPSQFRPLVAIGHSKDLDDIETIERLLAWLKEREISIGTLQSTYSKCLANV